MSSVTITDKKRSLEAVNVRFNPAQYSKKVFGMYGGKEELVTLECKEKLAGVVIDRFGSDVRLSKCIDGFRVSVRVMLSPNFFGWVLSFGNDMKIVAPNSVVTRMRDVLREIAENYEKAE